MLRAAVHFVDGNRVWRESGLIERCWLGPYGGELKSGFVLREASEGGNRVFPIAGRQAEVYLHGEGTPWVPVVRTCDGEVLHDELPLPPLEKPCDP